MQKRAKTSEMRAFDKTHWTEGGETLCLKWRDRKRKRLRYRKRVRDWELRWKCVSHSCTCEKSWARQCASTGISVGFTSSKWTRWIRNLSPFIHILYFHRGNLQYPALALIRAAWKHEMLCTSNTKARSQGQKYPPANKPLSMTTVSRLDFKIYISVCVRTSGIQSCKGQQKMCLGWTETFPQMLPGKKGFCMYV